MPTSKTFPFVTLVCCALAIPCLVLAGCQPRIWTPSELESLHESIAIYRLYEEGDQPTRFGKALFIGMAYVAANASPSPEMTTLIYTLLGVVLGIVSLIAIVWVKFKMNKGLFEPDLSD